MKAWHFVGKKLRDGHPVPRNGRKLKHDGPLVICQSGLHASVMLIDALRYAPGTTLCHVEMDGEMHLHDDKLVARERTIVWRIDAEEVLREFARRCALDVIHLWKAPDVVVRYLKTGDESLRDAAARAAARAAAHAAASAARAATRAAAASAAYSGAASAARQSILLKQNRRLVRMAMAEHRRVG